MWVTFEVSSVFCNIKGIEDISIVKSAFKLLVKDKGILSLEGPFAGSKTLGYNQARRGSKKSATWAACAGTKRGGRREARPLSRWHRCHGEQRAITTEHPGRQGSHFWFCIVQWENSGETERVPGGDLSTSHEESMHWPGLENPSCVTEFLGGY